MKHKLDIDLTPNEIAKICGVTTRTVRRWIAGHTRPPKTSIAILELHQSGRIMPQKWPHSWRFNTAGFLDIGHKQALAWQQIDWYFYSVTCWHRVLELIPKIEARLDELARTAPPATIIELDKYRQELRRLKSRQFSLPIELTPFYEPQPKQQHRKNGC